METPLRKFAKTVHRRGRATANPASKRVPGLQVQAEEEGQVIVNLVPRLPSFLLRFCVESSVSKHLEGDFRRSTHRSDHQLRRPATEDQTLAGLDGQQVDGGQQGRLQAVVCFDGDFTPPPPTTTTPTSDFQPSDCSGHSCTLENSALD